MADSSLSYTQAVELLSRWYHEMRVDHLTTDELLFELSMRTIVIRDDPSFTRRKRSLREHLKIEKEDGKIINALISVNVGEAIEACKKTYEEICGGIKRHDQNVMSRCKTRLLHYAHKVYQLLLQACESCEQEETLKVMFVEIVGKIRLEFFATEDIIEEEQEQVDNDELLDTVEDNSDTEPNDQAGVNPQIIKWIRSLQVRITYLEKELSDRSNQRHIATQTAVRYLDNEEAQHNSSLHNNFPQLKPIVNSTTQNRTLIPPHKNLLFTPNQVSFPESKVILKPADFGGHLISNQTQNLSFHQPDAVSANPRPNYPNPSPTYGPYGYNHILNNPTVPTSGTTLNNANIWANFPSSSFQQYSNPNQASYNQAGQGTSFRHSLPVSKWAMNKYDGEDQGLKLNEFLEIVQALSMAEHVSETELFESAVHLFAGPALKWYMTMRTTGRLLNWQHLVLELRRSFMHPDLDALIKMKVYQRRQQRNETFLEFYHEMERLFRTMSTQLPDYEKVQILSQNMRIDYKKQLNFIPITDLATLVAAGQKVDALNFSAYNKVFGTDKQVAMIDQNVSKKKPKKESSNDSQSLQTLSPQHNSNPRYNQQTSTPPQRNAPQSQIAATFSNSNKTSQPTLEALIDSHRPPPSNHCLNCGIFGHRISTCRLPKGVLCGNCGFRGYPSNNCPYCTKNYGSASENRRPLNT
ncbi:uncharacterized protein LOC131691724 [Topomyia yanbarensis]|uniref:uncharacterized protein LOC131691724 n=1 Tax=Topomyia yanbarensis TaxID=2498891 RepID=UPI00273C5FC8|nr:uncharacterized protein LOC131691724 [Topomyia yanbarensis]